MSLRKWLEEKFERIKTCIEDRNRQIRALTYDKQLMSLRHENYVKTSNLTRTIALRDQEIAFLKERLKNLEAVTEDTRYVYYNGMAYKVVDRVLMDSEGSVKKLHIDATVAVLEGEVNESN